MTSATIKISEGLQEIAARLHADLVAVGGEQDVAFSLFVRTQGRASYIANCDRKEIIDVLEAMIGSWKQGMPDVPAHKVS